MRVTERQLRRIIREVIIREIASEEPETGGYKLGDIVDMKVGDTKLKFDIEARIEASSGPAKSTKPGELIVVPTDEARSMLVDAVLNAEDPNGVSKQSAVYIAAKMGLEQIKNARMFGLSVADALSRKLINPKS